MADEQPKTDTPPVADAVTDAPKADETPAATAAEPAAATAAAEPTSEEAIPAPAAAAEEPSADAAKAPKPAPRSSVFSKIKVSLRAPYATMPPQWPALPFGLPPPVAGCVTSATADGRACAH